MRVGLSLQNYNLIRLRLFLLLSVAVRCLILLVLSVFDLVIRMCVYLLVLVLTGLPTICFGDISGQDVTKLTIITARWACPVGDLRWP